jgi:hypothetical protein
VRGSPAISRLWSTSRSTRKPTANGPRGFDVGRVTRLVA